MIAMKRSQSSNNQENSKQKSFNQQISVNTEQKTQEIVIFLNIKLIIEDKHKKSIEQMIEQFPINNFLSKHKDSSKRTLILVKLIHELKAKLNFPLQDHFIYFYLDIAQIFMKCGKDPISPDIKIRPEYFKQKNFVTIKAISKSFQRGYQMMKLQTSISSLMFRSQTKNECDIKNTKREVIKQKKKGGHGQERKIGFIIDKVQQWQKIYKERKISLQDAADKVEISKKSLDEYWYQLKKGNQWKFNFTEHADQKVGLLRDFVRKNNQLLKKKQEKKTVKILKKQESRRLSQRDQFNKICSKIDQQEQSEYLNKMIQ